MSKTDDAREIQIHAEQIRLLYLNSYTAFAVAVCAASVLCFLQWSVISHRVILGWLAYMLAISFGRFELTRLYWRATPMPANVRSWGMAFAAGAGMAGVGWGAAGILLYPEANISNQLFLAFVLGGMMLGAGAILAARVDVSAAFIVPAGVPITVRLLLQPDRYHHAMGLLAGIFTAATLLTTWRICMTVRSSLNLQFENRDLVVALRTANQQTETLNLGLESRVRERTAELHEANERLHAEIEHRKQMEEELLRARKLEALSVLAGGIAHDFNNILTIIQGNIELARLSLKPENPAREILDRIDAACQRAASLASQLLTFGKGGAPVRRTVSVVKLVKDAVEFARAGSNVGIDLKLTGDLWPVEVDAAQIFHAIQNILINARQAMPQGGLIEVHAENLGPEAVSPPLRGDKYVQISVRDNGCGIAPENLPRIFDPYFTTKPKGAGLGLAAAYSIIAQHQGHIGVQSKVGSGTVFQICLPAAEKPPVTAQEQAGAIQNGTGRILVMDDEEAIRALLTGSLTQLGYEVVCAREGSEAIGLYEEGRNLGRRFDLVLLDLTIPGGMGGIETAARLRDIDPSAKLIASSGYADSSVMSDSRRYGFDETIPKPWTLPEMSRIIRKVLLHQAETAPSPAKKKIQ